MHTQIKVNIRMGKNVAGVEELIKNELDGKCIC